MSLLPSTSSTKKGPPGGRREIFRVALPLVISMGSYTVMQFVDRVFLARHSGVSIQAALPAGILAFTLSCGFMELAGYATTFVAQFHGAGDRRGCARAAAQAVLIALGSWPILLLLVPVGRWIIVVSGHAPAVQAEELAYFTWLMVAGVTIPLGVAAAAFFTGRGDTRTPMIANLVGNALNIMLDYLFIFGKWGAPEMGIRGAALATIVASVVTPAILLVIFSSSRTDAAYHTRRSFRPDFSLLRRIVRFGLPSSVHFFLDVTSFSFFVLLIGRMGTLELATSNMAFSINMLAFMPLIGLGITATTLVGKYQGRGKSANAEWMGWATLRVGIGYTLVVGLSYLLLPQLYFSFFTQDAGSSFTLQEVLPLGRLMLVMMALWAVMDAGNLILAGALKGAGDTTFVMFYSVAMSWGVFLTGELVLMFVLHAGVLYAWGWLAFYVMLAALGYAWRFRSGRWKSINLLDRPSEIPVPHPSPEALVVPD